MTQLRITLGVTGGVAAYKAAELVRRLQQDDFSVQVVMTRGAREFVTPLTFAALIVATNVILVLLIIRPVRRLAHVANQVSTGQLEGAELPVRGKDEIAELTASFNRLFTSLAKAMRLLE